MRFLKTFLAVFLISVPNAIAGEGLPFSKYSKVKDAISTISSLYAIYSSCQNNSVIFDTANSVVFDTGKMKIEVFNILEKENATFDQLEKLDNTYRDVFRRTRRVVALQDTPENWVTARRRCNDIYKRLKKRGDIEYLREALK